MGTVYILWSRDTGTYKVGYTRAKNAKNRIADLKVGHPFPLEVVREYTVNNPRRLEERLHARFKAKHVQGEWFRLDGGDLHEADTIAEKFDDLGVERNQRKPSKQPVSLYTRDKKGFHFADTRSFFAEGTVFVLRYEVDGKRTWERLPKGTQHKEARKLGLEKALALMNAPVVIPSLRQDFTPKKPNPAPGLTLLTAACDAYIDGLYADGNLTTRTIKDKRFELTRWIDRCKKTHVEQIDRTDLIAFRDSLRRDGLAEWTVKTNLTSVATMLKHNPLRRVESILKREDWPVIEDSEPHPYTVDEVKALQSVANGMERLLIRTFIGTGLREQEVAHMEWQDIDWVGKTVRIAAKPKYNWKPKTRAGCRTVPLPDSLVRDLKAMRQREGLVFPAPRGGVDKHYLRVIERLAKLAGVEGAGCHRFRDSYITDQVQAGVDLLTLRKWVGHQNLETLKLYSEALKAKDQRARDAANRQDKYTFAAHAAD